MVDFVNIKISAKHEQVIYPNKTGTALPLKANPIGIAIKIPNIVADAPIIADAIPAISPIGSMAKAFKLPKYKPFKKKAITDQRIKVISNHSTGIEG